MISVDIAIEFTTLAGISPQCTWDFTGMATAREDAREEANNDHDVTVLMPLTCLGRTRGACDFPVPGAARRPNDSD